ncbi:UNVERIFIED_CONTAM: hypothetical protein K2H54_073387, partial [Gekko kuhli]
MQDLPLDMANTSFDDQYDDCVDEMDAMVGELQHTEFADKNYANVWKHATDRWYQKKHKGLKPEYGIAVIAYTEESSLYKELNKAVRKAGQSKDYYLKNFQFKSFHYLLTRALQVLRSNSNQKCYTTYRGVGDVRFITERSKKVRFGNFASSSLKEDIGKGFGGGTFFTIKTCHGANIKRYSIYRGEEEVLIPPYEEFKVEHFVKTSDGEIHISLTSIGKSSNYNCVYTEVRRKLQEFFVRDLLGDLLRTTLPKTPTSSDHAIRVCSAD